MKLHIGCGSIRKEGYINIDSRATNATDEVMDATALKFASGSVDEISSCHMIEHLDKAGGKKFLTECKRVLKQGGTLHLELPILEKVVEMWRDDRLSDTTFINALYGIQRHPGDFHRYGYTTKTITTMLQDMGFFIKTTKYGREGYGPNSPGIRIWAVKS